MSLRVAWSGAGGTAVASGAGGTVDVPARYPRVRSAPVDRLVAPAGALPRPLPDQHCGPGITCRRRDWDRSTAQRASRRARAAACRAPPLRLIRAGRGSSRAAGQQHHPVSDAGEHQAEYPCRR